MHATALIAEDEPLLAASLQAELARAWPELRIVASVGHGAAAVREALAQRPQVLFLDIRMPGMTGLEAAEALAEEWPADPATPFPLIVFVTAYDQYAVQAFERAAIDYVLKPVQPERLDDTCRRLRQALAARVVGERGEGGEAGEARQGLAAEQVLGEAIVRLQGLLAAVPADSPLRVIQASVGNVLHMVPVAEVLYFEAADKYVRVVTAERDLLVRTSLRELQPRLEPGVFWQIHRGTLVRAEAIATAVRDEAGRVSLTLRGRPERLNVSRLYTHLFKAM